MLTTALIESLIANYLKSSDGYGIEFCMKAASLCSEIVKDTVTKAAQGVLSASDTEVKTIADNILNDLHSHWMETPSHIVEITSRLAEAIAEKGGDVFDEQDISTHSEIPRVALTCHPRTVGENQMNMIVVKPRRDQVAGVRRGCSICAHLVEGSEVPCIGHDERHIGMRHALPAQPRQHRCVSRKEER